MIIPDSVAHGPIQTWSPMVGLDQVERVIRDIEQKRRTTAYRHETPALVTPVP